MFNIEMSNRFGSGIADKDRYRWDGTRVYGWYGVCVK